MLEGKIMLPRIRYLIFLHFNFASRQIRFTLYHTLVESENYRFKNQNLSAAIVNKFNIIHDK